MSYKALFALTAAFAFFGAAGCDRDNTDPLNETESKAVMQLREEEKLARDVYQVLSKHDPVFSSVQASEQNHLDAVGRLISNHDLDDPIAGKDVGEFSSEEMQDLHDQLVEIGSRSLEDALMVGTEIEELDIRDLYAFTPSAEHNDVENVFGNLARGSRNHLRTFHSMLIDSGGSYAPKYLDQATFDSIVNSDLETGPN